MKKIDFPEIIFICLFGNEIIKDFLVGNFIVSFELKIYMHFEPAIPLVGIFPTKRVTYIFKYEL